MSLTDTAKHVLWKAKEIKEAHDRGDEIDGLRLSWARIIIAANRAALDQARQTVGEAREGGRVSAAEITAALKASGDIGQGF